MRLLALDASTEACSVALLTDRGCFARALELKRGHAEELLGMVRGILEEAGVGLGMLDGIAAGVGPGAFTGVRISVAVAQGLAYGAGLPVVPVSTLEALALRAISAGAEQVLACLDARMGEVYFGAFAADAERRLLPLSAAGVGAPAAVKWPASGRFRGIGRGFAAYPELASLDGLDLDGAATRALPDAREIAVLGVLRLEAGEALDPADLEPVYIRDRVALTEAERQLAK
jgi:tRNA threonylcarbamoyladenosine biosynthesis protein TsaB